MDVQTYLSGMDRAWDVFHVRVTGLSERYSAAQNAALEDADATALKIATQCYDADLSNAWQEFANAADQQWLEFGAAVRAELQQSCGEAFAQAMAEWDRFAAAQADAWGYYVSPYRHLSERSNYVAAVERAWQAFMIACRESA